MDFKIIDPNDFPFYCGTCLTKFTDIKHDVNEIPTELLQLFQQLTKYEISDESLYPDGICEKCYSTLNDAYNFQIISKKSKKYLDEILIAFTTKPVLDCEENESTNKTDENILDPLITPNMKEISLDDPLKNESEKITVKIEADIFNELESEENNSKRCINEAQNYNVSSSEVTCNIKSYSTSAAVSLHMQSHSPDNTIKCDQHLKEPLKIVCKYGCGKTFNRSHQAFSHYQRKHSQNKNSNNDAYNTNQITSNATIKGPSYTCNDCGKALKNIRCLKHHRRKHHQSIDVTNTIDKNLNSNDEINGEDMEDENFLMSSVNSIIGRTCTICKKIYASASGLALHMHSHQETRPFQCDQCDQGFNAKISLKRHMETHLKEPLQIICKYGCGQIFNRSHSANKHYQTKHPQNKNITDTTSNTNIDDPTYICEDCGKVCKNLRSFKQHRNRHLPYEERPYPCKQCNKRFGAPTDLLFHMRRHDGIKNFECSYCGVKTVTGRELRLHVSNVHTKEMQVSCDICSKVFLHLGSLRRHEKVVHQGIKNYKCKYCEQSFAKAETLKNHEMRHTGERPYKCKYCDKSFIQSFMRNTHMKKHHAQFYNAD